MLFNSYIFLFFFLPCTLLGYHLLAMRGNRAMALGFLVAASLCFYSWWNPQHLALLAGSVCVNYLLAGRLGRTKGKALLMGGVCFNLGLIAYFKYVFFFANTFTAITGTPHGIHQLVLPLGISFFTFQQITYLVDTYRGRHVTHDFLSYALFVTFFPQLIAGPIVHHSEMLPQFAAQKEGGLLAKNLGVGFTLFFIGLFKKVIFADTIAAYATPIFTAAEHGVALTFAEAWTGALAYTFQLYFDFSGYSDMAIGLARMFGITLPANFLSPYKATSIIDFWRRWHITLSRFLRDYVYFSLGGSKKGTGRTLANLMMTMLLGGLWHGAGWTFVLWGGLHGAYLVINHAWRRIKARPQAASASGRNRHSMLYRPLTFIAVVVAWVLFRATSIDGGMSIIGAMFGLNGLSLPVSLAHLSSAAGTAPAGFGIHFDGMFNNAILTAPLEAIACITLLWTVTWFAPNSIEIMRSEQPALLEKEDLAGYVATPIWRPTPLYLMLTMTIATVSILLLQRQSEFLYFQF